MKKLFCILLALGVAVVGAACGEEEPSGSRGNNPAGEFDEIKGEQVTKEQWDEAWQQFKTADNATIFMSGGGEDNGEYAEAESTLKVADGKFHYYEEGFSLDTESGEKETWKTERYVGKVDDTLYKWNKYDDEDWSNAFEVTDFMGEIALGCSLVIDQVELYLDYEQMSYSNAKYDETRNAYVLSATKAYPDGSVGLKAHYEIKIVGGSVCAMEVTTECYYGSSVVEEEFTFSYVFTYGGVAIGNLPPLQAE